MGVLTGRIALVTVDSDGIGAEIARVFAAEGAAVAVHGHDPKAVEIVVEEIRWEGGRAVAITGDVSNSAEIYAVREAVERQLGPVDIFVATGGAIVV